MAIKTARNDSSLIDTLGSKLPIAGGKILQIVRATDTTERSTTSTSFTDVTGMSVTISPQKSDSAVLLIATFRQRTTWSTGDDGFGFFQITDSSNNAISGAENHAFGTVGLTGTGGREVTTSVTMVARATPATTSATTYKLRFSSNNANTTNWCRNQLATGQMYAIEVSA
jgi:hypothetical protein